MNKMPEIFDNQNATFKSSFQTGETTINQCLNNREHFNSLEQEIESLEKELGAIELQMRNLELQIQTRYTNEIARIRELSNLYKKQKNAKKEKRLAQKKRGKNYREPKGLLNSDANTTTTKTPLSHDKRELKRLYREAILQVHPDKFINEPQEKNERSLELTLQLIDIYQNGDLQELQHMYRHIMSGNAMAQGSEKTPGIPDPVALQVFLTKKRDDLVADLYKVKLSQLYEVLETNPDTNTFVNGLSIQLVLRIRQLEKRTRV